MVVGFITTYSISAYPDSDWANDFGRPWWKDDGYLVGILSQKTRKIKIINTLTSQDHVIEVFITSLSLERSSWL
jgi:hypothetical protein